jgi:hypothetical protein
LTTSSQVEGIALSSLTDLAGRHVAEEKSDSIAAEIAAKTVLSQVAQATPKSALAQVEMIRMLKISKHSAVRALNQMQALLVTAPTVLSEALGGLSATKLETVH